VLWDYPPQMSWAADLVAGVVRHYLSLAAVLETLPRGEIAAQEYFGPLIGHAPSLTPELWAAQAASPPSAGLSRILLRLAWGRWQFARMAETVRQHGARRIGYYAMPVLGGNERVYWQSACAERPFCITPDEDIMARLMEYEAWYDGLHLSAEGRRLATVWLAGRLAQHLRASPPRREVSQADH
jgi:hypothetical protein